MKYLLILLFISQAFANQTPEVKEAFVSIVDAHAKALEQMESDSLPNGFKLTEMVTDLAVSKTGLLGLAALKSNNGVEIKWKKAKRPSLIEENEVDIVVNPEITERELSNLSDTIYKIAESSGKVKTSPFLRSYIEDSLKEVQENIQNIEVTRFKNWKASGLRFDLNFGANGQLWFVARAGVTLRIRMEWKLIDNSSLTPPSILKNESRFVLKILDALSRSLETVTLRNFNPTRICIGVGASYKRGFFGLWKYSAGFIGWLSFTPVQNLTFNKSLQTLPLQVLAEDFSFGDDEKASKIPHSKFVEGMTRSLETAAFFADNADTSSSQVWQVAEIKTVNDISYKGLFGLSDFTTRGIVEIDFKRMNP